MEKNLKQLDRERILVYLANKGCVEVDELIEKSVADKLRIYPLLAELVIEKRIRVLKETGWGAPERVELNR